MKTVSKYLTALMVITAISFTGCRDTKTEATDDHGHEHNADGTHMNEEKVEQEEFQVGKDSMEMKTQDQGHEHDADGHSHDDDGQDH